MLVGAPVTGVSICPQRMEPGETNSSSVMTRLFRIQSRLRAVSGPEQDPTSGSREQGLSDCGNPNLANPIPLVREAANRKVKLENPAAYLLLLASDEFVRLYRSAGSL